jgi:hypothetical protein
MAHETLPEEKRKGERKEEQERGEGESFYRR